MTSNPFNFNLPTRFEDFIGRHAEVKSIADDLYARNGDSYCILGGRRIGKTSLLYALQSVLIRHWEQGEEGDLRVLPIYVPLKALTRLRPLTSAGDVFEFIVHRIREAIDGSSYHDIRLKRSPLELGLSEYRNTGATS